MAARRSVNAADPLAPFKDAIGRYMQYFGDIWFTRPEHIYTPTEAADMLMEWSEEGVRSLVMSVSVDLTFFEGSLGCGLSNVPRRARARRSTF